jgi:enoyl-CoA hydratase/carnithine racemase
LIVQKTIDCFELKVVEKGITLVPFSRPLVNSISLSVCEHIGTLVELINTSSNIRVLVLTAPETSREWCVGADVKDFEAQALSSTLAVGEDSSKGARTQQVYSKLRFVVS